MPSPSRHEIERDGTRLRCFDHGGDGPPVVLLHGLAGYAGEWDETAAWLSSTHRVVVPEQRGHGRSDRRPRDVSRAAFVSDAVAWINALGLAPAAVVGQSLGGHTAFLLAARHPELVSALVVAEATPEPDPDAPVSVAAWLDDWPIPFATRAQAAAFFGGGIRGGTWAEGLECRDGGLWPAFDPQVMAATLSESAMYDYWDDWSRTRCPTLVVRAADGDDAAVYARMVAVNPGARLVEIEGAGHDVHLDRPAAWRAAVELFLGGCGVPD